MYEMNLFGRIIYSGTKGLEDGFSLRGVVISNYISLILCLAVSVLFFVKNVFANYRLYDFNIYFFLGGLAIFSIPMLLNRTSHTIAGRLILCIGSMGYVWFVFIYKMMDLQLIEEGVFDGLRIYLLAISPIPFLVFNYRKYPLHLLFLSFATILSLVFFEDILSLAGVGYSQKGIPGEDHISMQIRSVMAYIVIFGGCFIFQIVINQNDRYNQRIKLKLRQKSEEIELQNTLLTQNQSKLNESNQHLEMLVEKKTDDLKIQSEKLISYAHLNGDQLKEPLNRLIHLMQQSRKKRKIDYPKLFDEIKLEAKQMEEIIGQISKDLNDYESI